MTEKIYIGTGREKTFPDGGSLIEITLSLDGLKEHYEKYGFETDQGKHKLPIIVSKRKEPDKFGHTHAVTVSTWKPDPNYRQSAAETPAVPPVNQEPDPDDFDFDPDVPF